MACRTLGDAFVTSSNAVAYRSAIQAQNWDSFDGCGLQLLWGADLPLVFLPDVEVHQHLVACFRIDPLIMTTVKLFGGVAISTFAHAVGECALRHLDGVVIVNNVRTRAITEQSLKDAVPQIEMVRRLSDEM